MATIHFMAFIQTETPTELTGKVMSLFVMFPFIASALGNLLYGVLFDHFKTKNWIVVFMTTFMVIIVALYSFNLFNKKTYTKSIPEE